MKVVQVPPEYLVPMPDEAAPQVAGSTVKNPQKPGSSPEQKKKGPSPRREWTYRAITEKEIQRLSDKDLDLTPVVCHEILARLNSKARYYIPDEIKAKRKLKVPKDFSAYKNWTPMPQTIPSAAKFPKFVVVVKNIPFLGWYENGKLVGDCQVCIGKSREWTKAGMYKVEEKDIDHISQSYPNAFGQPSPMPFALRIYGRVWIHAGDVVGGYSSHGCINLPLKQAEEVFNWADPGTKVLVVDSLKDLGKAVGVNRKVQLADK